MNRMNSLLLVGFAGLALLVAGCNDHAARQPGNGAEKTNAGKGETEAKNEAVDLNTLLKPTNGFVVSAIPVTVLRTGDQPVNREVLGRVDYDTRQSHTISARVSGRIEKLYVKYRYQHVHQGYKIMDIYSPELVTAQQDLLFLLRNDPDNATLVSAAKERILLLGMSEQQLEQVMRSGKASYTVSVYSAYSGHIHGAGSMNEMTDNGSQRMDVSKGSDELAIKEGMYVTKGQTVFQLFNTDNSWVVLNIFAADLPFIKPGTSVTITPETAPDKPFDARVNFVETFFRDNNKTLTARIYFNNATREIPIGSQVKAIIHSSSGLVNWLPRESILSLGLNHVVLRKEEGGFKVQAIRTGIMTDSLIQVMDGLIGQDSVAADAQFLMDSESFIKLKQ